MKLHGYPKLWTWPQSHIETIFDGDVVIQEKYDGSQFSFGRRGDDIWFRTRGAELLANTTDKLFAPTIDRVFASKHLLPDGWTFRGEALRGPKHNTKLYARAPRGNLVLFDVETIPGKFLRPDAVRTWAEILQVEPVRTIFVGTRLTETIKFMPWSVWLERLLENTSTLGEDVPIEGIVIKAYDQITRLGHCMMGKIVSPDFKEQHKSSNKTFMKGNNYASAIGSEFATDARWRKSVQHLRDCGSLTNSPRDIGPLLEELQRDFEAECSAEVARELYTHYRKTILKSLGRGFAEWYKAELRAQSGLLRNASGRESNEEAVDESSDFGFFGPNSVF